MRQISDADPAAMVGVLVALAASEAGSPAIILYPRTYTIGRSADSDIVLTDAGNSVSRQHAVLSSDNGGFQVRDVGSSHGTLLNGSPLTQDVTARLRHGDDLAFARHRFRYLEAIPSERTPTIPAGSTSASEGMASLEPAEVVRTSLEVLRAISGIERSMLVGTGQDAALSGFLTSLDDPGLGLSRSLVREALETGHTVARFLDSSGKADLTRSMELNQLRRVWIHPLFASEGRALGAVYLDSSSVGEPMSPALEARLLAVCRQIALALRNAVLFHEVIELNRTLEARVEERTRALERSQVQLIAQDRLATLGRLVAGIAHELNNPAAAIDSFSSTLARLLPAVQAAESQLERSFPEPAVRERARHWLALSVAGNLRAKLDTRARRELEEGWRIELERHGLRDSEMLAQRLARIGLAPELMSKDEPMTGAHREELAALLESSATFTTGLLTLQECARNISRIVKGLKTYAHLDQAQAELADLDEGLAATVSIMQSRVPAAIEVVTRLGGVPPFVHRPGELMQVWTNLIDNALHAMGESGRLIVESHVEGDAAIVSVTDSGHGIPADMKDRIFELDTTTRGPGAGLGLGLAICRKIVEDGHRGGIAVQSEPGRTVFRVTLPMRPAAAAMGARSA